MASRPATEDVLQGTLELLILRTLSLAPMHGWGITQRIQQLSSDAFQVGQGSLYPALQRLEKKGWIESDWDITENNRRAKYYTLTAAGRRALGTELESWRRFVGAVELVIAGTARGRLDAGIPALDRAHPARARLAPPRRSRSG